MQVIRFAALMAAALVPHIAQATQVVSGSAIFEDFENYDLGLRSIAFCPGDPGPDNSGLDCDFGTLLGGSIAADTADFPATSGSHVYLGTTISLEGLDAFNNSWPGIYANVTSSSAPVTLIIFAYDHTLETEVEYFTSTIAANQINQLVGTGTELLPVFLTRFVFASTAIFAIDGLQLGLENVAVSVPEPATWLMLVAGFGAAGGALRLRRRQTA